jgi:hemolysin D
VSLKIRLQAFGDLVARYRAVWSQAWQDRRGMETDAFRRDEAEFLPAALALQEEPLSPTPRLAAWLLITFAVLALLWSILGHIDIVATAEGKIVASSRTKTIQPVETAAVKTIYVSEGQSVKAGDALIDLDGAMLAADRDRIASSLTAAKLQSARGKALLAAISTAGLPRIPPIPGVDPALLEKAQQWVEGQYNELTTKLADIDAENIRKANEIKSTEELVRSLEETVPIEEARTRDLGQLLDEGYVAKHTYYERQQSWLEKKGNLANQRSRLREFEAALQGGQQKRHSLLAETRRTTLDSYNEGEQKIAELGQDFIKADTHNNLMHLTSPVDGTVQQLAVHTIGGVVTPAQALMMVVPRAGGLEVEAFLQNKDVGFVAAGQEAEVKVETFQYTKYGTVHATVAHVSHDAIEDEKKGRIYMVRVKLDETKMHVDDKLVDLAPGESVTVSIKTGKRRVIEYFLSPLMQYQKESLGER